MIKYNVSDYLLMKERAEKVANTIVSSGSHYEAFVFYKILIYVINMKTNVKIEIEESEKYLDIEFLRAKYVELLNCMNELCRENGLEF